jgi:hypothetical protein
MVMMPSRMKIQRQLHPLVTIRDGGCRIEFSYKTHLPFFTLDAVHLANSVCQETTEAGTEHTESEEHSIAERSLFAGVVLGDEQSGTWSCQPIIVPGQYNTGSTYLQAVLLRRYPSRSGKQAVQHMNLSVLGTWRRHQG